VRSRVRARALMASLPKPTRPAPAPRERIRPRCVCGHSYHASTCGLCPLVLGCQKYRPARSSVLRSPGKNAASPKCAGCKHPKGQHQLLDGAGTASGCWVQRGVDGYCLCLGFVARKSAPARTKRPRRKSKNPLATQRTKTWDLFAAYVKQRDGDVCFSCGKGGLISHDWHAGHMFPSGNNAVIRYEPKNVHSQCGRCNCFLRGNGAAYVAHFLEVYGLAELQRIQAKRGQEKRWTRVELEEMATVLQRGGADFECWYAERYGL